MNKKILAINCVFGDLIVNCDTEFAEVFFSDSDFQDIVQSKMVDFFEYCYRQNIDDFKILIVKKE